MRAILAPCSVRYSIVGSEARMRVSSVILPPSRGTLKSTRTRTRLPLTSRSLTDCLGMSYLAAAAASSFVPAVLSLATIAVKSEMRQA